VRGLLDTDDLYIWQIHSDGGWCGTLAIPATAVGLEVLVQAWWLSTEPQARDNGRRARGSCRKLPKVSLHWENGTVVGNARPRLTAIGPTCSLESMGVQDGAMLHLIERRSGYLDMSLVEQLLDGQLTRAMLDGYKPDMKAGAFPLE